MTRHLLFVVLVGVSVWMMEAKAVPAKRRPSSSPMRSLFGSLEDDMMMPAVPAMVMMPSFVYYYHVVSPFHRMGKSMMPLWSKFGFESSEEEEDDDEEEEEQVVEESKKIEEISKVEAKKSVKESGINEASSADEEKESPTEEEEEEETQTEKEKVTESELVTEDGIDEDGQVTMTTEFPAITEPADPQTTEVMDDNSVTEATAATTTTAEFQQQMDDQDKLTKSDSRWAKTSGRSSTTYVCKFGKCQHTMEAKKLLEQEIEAELWAKL